MDNNKIRENFLKHINEAKKIKEEKDAKGKEDFKNFIDKLKEKAKEMKAAEEEK